MDEEVGEYNNNLNRSFSDESDADDINESSKRDSKTQLRTGDGILTLEDNDEDSAAFNRPDITDLFEENGEDEENYDEKNINSINNNNNNNRLGTNKISSKKSLKLNNNNNNKVKKKRQIGICVIATKYECVRRVGRKLGFKEVDEQEDWLLYWTDTSVSIERVNQMKRWQKINHYPGMSEICRKDFLTRNMNRMAKMFPKEYNFYPKAWCLPAE
jgi:hypothetical protein